MGRVAEYLEATEEQCEYLTTTINLKEVAVGLVLQRTLDRASLLATLDWLEIVPFDADAAFEAGQLEATLRRDDVAQDRMNALGGDVLIAAVARAHDAAVVTRKVADFELLGVDVDPYRVDRRRVRASWNRYVTPPETLRMVPSTTRSLRREIRPVAGVAGVWLTVVVFAELGVKNVGYYQPGRLSATLGTPLTIAASVVALAAVAPFVIAHGM